MPSLAKHGSLCIALCLTSSPALAKEVAAPSVQLDTSVSLTNGSIYRGELLELAKGDHITIRAVSGKIYTFSWPEISRAMGTNGTELKTSPKAEAVRSETSPPAYREPKKQPIPALPAPPTAPAAPSPADEFVPVPFPAPKPSRPQTKLVLPPDLRGYEDEIVVMKLSSPERKIKLQFLQDSVSADVMGVFGWMGTISSEKWTTICKYPCNQPIARDATYRVIGDSISDSRDFTLPAEGRQMTLFVKPGKPGLKALGAVQLSIGSALHFTGITMAVIGFATNASSQTTQAGIGLGVSGLVLGLLSIPELLAGRTKVTVETDAD